MPRIEPSWLERALTLAEKGRYGVSPNPMVGAVLVRAGRPVAEGHHARAGGPHAEIVALRRAGAAARGADLYVSLEPCVHQGRTPACVPAVLAAGVRRVVVAATDPNPRVSGRGVAALRAAGVEVVLAGAPWRLRAERQNAKFRKWIAHGKPFVLAKWAQSLDGRTVSARGESRWITGKAARRRGMLLREEYDAVLVGAGTVRADDPLLTRRLGRSRTPHWRIVLDGRLRIPEGARVLRGPGPRLVVTAERPAHPRARRLKEHGVEVWSMPGRAARRVDIPRMLSELGRRGVTGLMVEGGSVTLAAFFEAGEVDAVAVFVAPRILGGASARGAVAGRGFRLALSPRIADLAVEAAGEDLLLTGRVT